MFSKSFSPLDDAYVVVAVDCQSSLAKLSRKKR